MGVALPKGAQLFKHEWWLAAYFVMPVYSSRSPEELREATYKTRHGHLPDHRLPDLMAGYVAAYQEQYYQRHGLLPCGYHTVEQAVWGVYPIWYPHFPVCFPFGLNSAGYPASPRSAETEAELRGGSAFWMKPTGKRTAPSTEPTLARRCASARLDITIAARPWPRAPSADRIP
jgi:hypothetical protein